MQNVYLGIDVGASSLKVAALNDAGLLLKDPLYLPHGKDLERIVAAVRRELGEFDGLHVSAAVFGAFSTEIAPTLGMRKIAEIQAHMFGAPLGVKYIIDIGAESCRFVAKDGRALEFFKPNSKCASGTGSFIEEQSEAMQYPSIDAFFAAAEGAESTAPIVARCAVFAKSRRVTTSSKGFSEGQIARGLVNCVARNLYSDVVKVERFNGPLTVHGRLAEKKLVTDFIREAKSVPDELFVPAEYPACQAAIGAARAIIGHEKYELQPPASRSRNVLTLESPLRLRGAKSKVYLDSPGQFSGKVRPGHEYAIGIDIGSRSTVLGLVDASTHELVDAIYLDTEGKPLIATRKGIAHFLGKHGRDLPIKAVATTGSSRYAVGFFINADFVEDEITAQAIGGLHLARQLGCNLRGIIEIGGQDSKYMEVLDGVVLSSAMNQICSAGTGTFIEEQALKLFPGEPDYRKRLDLFDHGAIRSSGLYTLHGRCTTFMKKECDFAAMNGVSVSDICAGIALGIARNYGNEFKQLEYLVESLKLVPNPDEVIFFQGGTARNVAVLAAFQRLHDFDRFVVPPSCAETGCLGIALYAIDRVQEYEHRTDLTFHSKFRGLDADYDYSQRTVVCRGCQNLCDVSVIKTAERTIYDGQKCDATFTNVERKTTARTPIERSREVLLS